MTWISRLRWLFSPLDKKGTYGNKIVLVFVAYIRENDLRSQLELQRRAPCLPRPLRLQGCPWGWEDCGAAGRLLCASAVGKTCVQAGPDCSVEKFLLSKNPTNFILQWGMCHVQTDAFKCTDKLVMVLLKCIIIFTNHKNIISYLTELLIFFFKCWQIYFLTEIKMILFSLECTNVLFIYFIFLNLSDI